VLFNNIPELFKDKNWVIFK